MLTGNEAPFAFVAGSSIHIQDQRGLAISLVELVHMRDKLQGLLDCDLPNLNNSISDAVSGSSVQAYLNNYPAWMNQVASVLADVQALYNYLNVVAQAASR